MREQSSSFLVLWTAAVLASSAAFCAYLTLRVRAVELGYELGRAHGQLGRMREVRRVLELEVASYQTPERVDLVARTLLGMAPPGSERMLRGAALPNVLDREREATREDGATRDDGSTIVPGGRANVGATDAEEMEP